MKSNATQAEQGFPLEDASRVPRMPYFMRLTSDGIGFTRAAFQGPQLPGLSRLHPYAK